MAEWFVRWTTKLATRVPSRVAAGLPTGYSVLGGNLTGYCRQQYRARLDNWEGNDTHRGLCWKYVVPSIPGGDFRRLSMLNKRPLPFFFYQLCGTTQLIWVFVFTYTNTRFSQDKAHFKVI